MRTVAEIIAHLRRLNIALFIDEGHLGYHAPEGALTPELRSELVANMDEILELLNILFSK